MHGLGGILVDGGVTGEGERDLEGEFERGLADSSALAFRVAYGVLRQREDAEDVAQEALVRAHRKLGSLRNPERLRAWLVRISWRLALDHRRSRRRRLAREQSWVGAAAEPDAADLADASRFRERLWQAIDALPEKLRLVLVLAGIEGHRIGEVAALLQLPEGTVKSRLFLARKRLAEVLR